MEMVMLGEMPSAADVAIFKAQYERALNGLYEAWKFGEMMRILKARMEGDNAESPGSLTRENARLTQPHGGALAAGGWNAGTGLKAWLGAHAREVNYKTAMRFLAIAERVAKVLELIEEGMIQAVNLNMGTPLRPFYKVMRESVMAYARRLDKGW